MNNNDFLFFNVNKFIDKIKYSAKNQKETNIKENNVGFSDSDYIDVDEKLNQENTLCKFYKIYEEEKKRYEKNHEKIDGKNYQKLVEKESQILTKTTFRYFWKIFFYIFIIRVINVSSDFFGPIILGRLLGMTTNSTENLTPKDKRICYLYISFFILSNITRIFSSMLFNYNLNLIRNQIDLIVNDLIFKKVLVTSKKSKNAEAKITKFLNDDVSTFFCFFINLNRAWELPIEIILAIYGTYKHVSMSFLPGLLFAIILLYVNYKIANSITSTNKDLYKVRLERQELEILAMKNVKSIKFEFLENFFLQKIFNFRKLEFNLLKFKKHLDALCCYLWAASPVLIAFCSIFSYILSGNLIDAEKVFTTISLLNMTIHPMNVFPWIFADFKDAKRVYEKFVKYLMKGKEFNRIEQNSNFMNKSVENQSADSNILLNISNVKIEYKKNSRKNRIVEEIKENNQESFQLIIEKKNQLNLKKGEIVLIYGNNASGKSLLLKSIIDKESNQNNEDNSQTIFTPFNEEEKIEKNSNKFFIKNKNISYVPQELWTFSASIYENVALETIKNEENLSRFYEVLKKCEMIKDINTFKERENRIINFKGSNISGGQKQRINIARSAFNTQSEIFLLDNCLSSIDENIANLIFDNLFQTLKNEGKGILFVTSDKKWLRKADKVYYIENNNLIFKDIDQVLKNEGLNHDKNYTSITSNLLNEVLTNEEVKENQINEIKSVQLSKTENEKISISPKTLIFFFSKAGYLLFLITILTLTGMQLGRNFIEIFLADWLKNDKLSLEKKKEIQYNNMKYYVFFVILHSIVTVGRSWFFAINFLGACDKIYKLTIEKFIFAKMKFFQNFNIGYLTNLLQNEILTIDESLPFEFNRLLDYTIKLIGSLIVIGYSTFSIYFIFLFLAFSYYYKNLYNDYTLACKFIDEKKNLINQPITNLFLDSLEGKSLISSFKKQSFFQNKLNDLLQKKLKIIHTDQCLWFWLSLRLDLLSFMIYTTVIILIGICVCDDRYELITFLSLALTTALNINSPLSSFLPWLGVCEDKYRAVERIRRTIEVIEDERENDQQTKQHKLDEFKDYESALELRDIYLKYDKEGEDILKGITLKIKKGEKIAIIGRTGAGKSTIISAITKQEKISKGEIIVEGKNVDSFSEVDIRNLVAFIGKEAFLMEGSIRENLDLMKNFENAEIEEFLYQFKEIFKMKEFEIFNNCNLYFQSIEKNGANLSEGQKSLLNILRSLLKKKAIIFFDESNSELDNGTEKLIFDIIFEKYKPVTFIVITHKLEILNKFDYIYLIENGKINKQGTPDEFLNESNLKLMDLK